MGSANILKINSLAWSIGKSRVQTFSLIELALQKAHQYVCYRLRIGTIPYQIEKALSTRNRPPKHADFLRKTVRGNDVGRARKPPKRCISVTLFLIPDQARMFRGRCTEGFVGLQKTSFQARHRQHPDSRQGSCRPHPQSTAGQAHIPDRQSSSSLRSHSAKASSCSR